LHSDAIIKYYHTIFFTTINIIGNFDHFDEIHAKSNVANLHLHKPMISSISQKPHQKKNTVNEGGEGREREREICITHSESLTKLKFHIDEACKTHIITKI
jgi:hypothetical protein